MFAPPPHVAFRPPYNPQNSNSGKGKGGGGKGGKPKEFMEAKLQRILQKNPNICNEC